MVRALELVLHLHPGARSDVLAQDVCTERIHRPLLRLELDSEYLAEDGQVLFAREPRREITGFTAPDVAVLGPCEPSKGPVVYILASPCAYRLTWILRDHLTPHCHAGSGRTGDVLCAGAPAKQVVAETTASTGSWNYARPRIATGDGNV